MDAALLNRVTQLERQVKEMWNLLVDVDNRTLGMRGVLPRTNVEETAGVWLREFPPHQK